MANVDLLQETQEELAQEEEAQTAATWEDIRTREVFDNTASLQRDRRMISLNQIESGQNIRHDLPDIEGLAISIREKGLLQSPIVSTDDGESYTLVAGARRVAALRNLYGDEYEVMCDVILQLDEAETIALMLVENEQRQPVEPLQAARAIRDLMRKRELASAGDVARSLGLSTRWVSERLKLLELPDEVQQRLADGDLSFRLADMLRKKVDAGVISGDEAVELADDVATGEKSVGEVHAAFAPPPADDHWFLQEDEEEEDETAVKLEDQATKFLEHAPASAGTTDLAADDLVVSNGHTEDAAAAMLLAQALDMFASVAEGLGIEDPWAEVPAMSLQGRRDTAEALRAAIWDELPERFRTSFVL